MYDVRTSQVAAWLVSSVYPKSDMRLMDVLHGGGRILGVRGDVFGFYRNLHARKVRVRL